MSDLLEQDLIQNGFEEKVTVNQRALIDKLLARYKGQFTVFRELIQNADDAKATVVKVKLYRNRSKAVLVVQNDGESFSETDWKRLIKIAEGNPNEDAVGCFGVGFYSVFSITENPIVSSNGQNLVFVWKQDQLTTFRNANTEGKAFSGFIHEEEKSWTHFIFQLREEEWDIAAFDFAQFLCQTLAFTQRVQTIEYHLDDVLKFSISRTTIRTENLKMHKSLRNFKSPYNIFKMNQVERKVQEFSAKFETTQHKLTLHLVEGVVTTCTEDKNTRAVEAQMLRILGKKFPSQSKIRMLIEVPDDSSKSIEQIDNDLNNLNINNVNNNNNNNVYSKEELFKELTPYPNRGRIFIGFSSHQTSGVGAHIACQLIPTVERENIDFSDIHFQKWNSDLIFTSGAILRSFYNNVMGSNVDPNVLKVIAPTTETKHFTSIRLHLLKSLSFQASSPSSEVTTLLKRGFFDDVNPIVIPCTAGLAYCSHVYLPYKDMENYVSIPVVPIGIFNEVSGFFKVLMDQKLIYELTFKVMIDNLKGMLNEDEVIDLLQWFMNAYKDKSISNDIKKYRRNFLESVQFQMKDRIVLLSDIKHFADKDFGELTIPHNTFPYSICKRLGEDKMVRDPLNLTKLPFQEWWSYIKDTSLIEQQTTSVNILDLIARKWTSLSNKDKDNIINLLQKKKCIVTEDYTMQKPMDTYMTHISLFENLNYVHSSVTSKLNSKFLQDLGVRANPDVKLVFSRLQELNWNLKTLIDFLINNESTFDEDDWKFLRSQKFLPVKGNNNNNNNNNKAIANQLLFPDNPIIESLQLPMLDWQGKLSNLEKSFLQQIGVREHPLLSELISMSASKDESKRTIAFQYLIDNFEKEYKSQYKFKEWSDVAFIPTTVGLSKINNCFHGNLKFQPTEIESLCYYLCCYEVDPKYRTRVKKLGVPEHPPINYIINKMVQNPPRDDVADVLFDYVNKYQSEITSEQWKLLKNSSFIPYEREWVSPSRAFLYNKDIESKYGALLDYLSDFSTNAKHFLKACGCSESPTPSQIADSLCKNYKRFLETRGVQKYTHVLDEISQSWETLPPAIKSKLSTTPCMLGTKLTTIQNGEKTETVQVAQLNLAKDIYLVDNIDYQRVFNVLSAVSVSNELDRMYESLGSSWLTSKIKEKSTEIGQGRETEKAKDMQDLINDRKPLLLNDINTCATREGIKSNAESLLLKLKILEVNKIKKELLLGSQRREIESVICTKTNSNGTIPIIYITCDVDVLQLASELATLLLVKKGKEDTLKFAALLQVSIGSLRQQGYPIDRLMPVNKKTSSANVNVTKSSKEEVRTEISTEVSPVKPQTQSQSHSNTVVDNTNYTSVGSSKTKGKLQTENHINHTISDFKRIDEMVSRAIKTTPGAVANQIIETSREIIETRCESKADRNLVKVGNVGGLSVYEENGGKSFSEEYTECANEFAIVLKNIAQVFSLKRIEETVRIFLESSNGTIAFNLNGGLHFNLIYFHKLHYNKKDISLMEVYFFWYSTFCHELAHNIVEAHNEEHGFLTEHLQYTYFKQLFPHLLQLHNNNNNNNKKNTKMFYWF